MKKLYKNDVISIFGNLNIQNIKHKKEKNICIAIENKKVKDIGNELYNILTKEYNNNNFNWFEQNRKLKTTKFIINNEIIVPKSLINIYGHVTDKGSNRRRYNFYYYDIAFEKIFLILENIYDDYINEFDTNISGLEFEIDKIEF